MAFKAGTTSAFYLGNVAAALQNLSPYLDTVDVPQSVDTLEVSVLGTAAKVFINGLTDGDTISIGGPYDVTTWTHLTALKAGQSAGSAGASLLGRPTTTAWWRPTRAARRSARTERSQSPRRSPVPAQALVVRPAARSQAGRGPRRKTARARECQS